MARPEGRVENRPVDYASATSERKLATGRDLVEETHRRFGIQQRNGSPAYALGRTLAGGGASVVHAGPGAPESSVPDDLPLVQHTLLTDTAQSTAPILLIAGNHQEAVDHCLVAHLAAERMTCRVEAGIAGSVAEEWGFAQLPDSGSLAGARESLQQSVSASESDLPTIVAGCLEASAVGLGRSAAPSVSCEPGGAAVIVVTLGFFSGLAEEVAARSNGRVGHLALRLLRPFPLNRTRELLSGKEAILLVAPRGSALHFEACHGIEQAVGGESAVRMVRVTGRADAAEFLQALSAAYPSEIWASLAPDVPESGRKSFRLGVAPSGPEGVELLVEAGSLLVESSPGTAKVALHRKDAKLASIAVGTEPDRVGALRALAIFEDRFTPAQEAINLLEDSGSVLIASCDGSPDDAWRRLSRLTRETILERGLRVLLVDLEPVGSQSRLAWAQALVDVARSGSTARATELDLDRLAGLESSAPTDAPAARFLPVGGTEESAEPKLVEAVRRFHLTGHLPEDHEPFSRDVPLRTLAASIAAAPFYESFPFYFPEDDQGEPKALFSMLSSDFETSKDAPVLTQVLPELVQLADQSARSSLQGTPLTAALEEALSRLSSAVELSEAGRQAFEGESEAVRNRLSQAGRLLSFRSETWFEFYRWASRRERKSHVRKVEEEALSLINRLEALVRADRSLRPESHTAASMASSLGSTGSGLIDLDRLAGKVPIRPGSRTLEPERLARIEGVVKTLRHFVDGITRAPELYVVSARRTSWRELGVCSLLSENPFEAARGVFEELMAHTLEIVRALRVGRLEVDGEYVPEIHDEMVRDLSWEAFESEELALTPGVLVLESARRLSEKTLAEFHQLVETGWPIHICLSVNESLIDGEDVARTLAGVLPDPGYFGLAQREAFVLQSTVARPDHLLPGLERMCRTPGPAVCVLAFPEQEGSAQWLWERCQSAWLSRATPLYVYDPWAGDSWADRFTLEGNPESEKALVTVEVADLGTQDASVTIDEALTFAHVLAQDPRFREQFWVIPSTAWSEEQKLVEEFLRDFTQPEMGVVPFIWVVDAQGRLQRAVATREVVSACRDRLRSWRILQELAGIGNVYVERAVEQVRAEASQAAQAEIEKVRQEARRAGAEEAIGKLVEVLSDLDSVSRALPSRPSAQEAPAREEAAEPVKVEPEETDPAAPEKEEPQTEEVGFEEEAYIDSFLCTSCNECINLNPRMFSYNADRQAFLADPSAGTFAELVKAAEACPARCIHPGAPPAGDSTATPDVVERAKAFR